MADGRYGWRCRAPGVRGLELSGALRSARCAAKPARSSVARGVPIWSLDGRDSPRLTLTAGERLDREARRMSGRWVAVGRSSAPQAVTAGREATAAALQNDDAQLLIVFCSDSYDLDELLDGIRGES